MAIIPQVITEDRASGAQVIDGSLRFDRYSSYYLTKTLSSVGNQRTFTFSCWCKRSLLGAHSSLFSSSGNGDFFKFAFRDDNRFEINTTDGGVDNTHLFSTAKFRNTTGWYHIVIAFDTTQATSTNRVKLYVNNTQITDFDLNTYPIQDTDTSANDNVQHIIGNQVGTTRYFDGMISNVYMIDGQQLGPEYFGFTDPLTNTWRPKKFESSINNGTTWSNDLTTANPNSGFRSGFPATWAFDGTRSGGATTDATDAGCQIVWSPTQFPASNGPYTLEVLCTGTAVNGGWDYRLLKVNGTTVFDPSVDTPPSSGFITVSNLTEITEVIVQRDATTGRAKLDMIRVNGVPLIDGTTNDFGVNGFYLPFDGNSPIGKDQSGNNNDWTPVNFGGSNSIEKATGALPILNTVNGGTTATATVREDANASNLIFALPLAGDITDITHKINNTRTQLSFTDAGSTDAGQINGPGSHFYGGSRNFDGTDDFLKASIPDGDGLHLQQSSWTVECWFNADALPGANDVYLGGVRIGTSANSDVSWNIRILNNVIEGLWVTSNTQYKTVSPYAITANKWTHVAYVRDGNEQRLYQDGVLVVTTSHTTTPNLNNSSFLEIGGRTGSGFFNGQIQDFRIYNNLAKYTSNFIPASPRPDILPDTPSGVVYGSELKQITEGSVNGGVSNGDTLLVGNSSDFDFGSGDFTVELFAYHTSTAGNDTLIGMWNSGANRRTWMIDIEADQGRLRGYWSTDGSTVSNVQTATNYTSRYRWNHIVFCRQGNTMRLYLNGNQEATATESGSLYNNTDDSLGILSATDAGNDPCKGHISNVRVIKGTCLYPDGTSFTPPSAPLTNVTNTKLLCCQSATSASAATVAPGTFVNDGTNYSSNNQVTGSAGLVNADSIFNGHLRASGVPALNEGATVSLSSDNYILWTPTTGIPYSSKVEIYCYAPNGYSITNYYTFNGGTETSFVGGAANYNGNTWITVATGSGTINSIKLRLTRTSPNQSQATWYAVRVDGTILLNDYNGKSIAKHGSVSASTFNPFNDNINTVRGQETGWATLNTLDRGNPALDDSRVKLSNGNLSWQGTLTGCAVRGTIPMTSGKWYWEVTSTVNTNRFFAGVMKTDVRPYDQDGGGDANSWVFQTDGNLYHNASSSAYGFATNSIDALTMVAYDADNGNLYFGGNGIWFNGSDPATGTSPAYSSVTNEGGISPVVSRRTGVCNCDINFGQNTFRFAPPEGFKTLCLANLPKPTSPAAVNPDKYFNTVLWTGNSSTQAITGVGFQPDFVWGKARSVGYAHKLFDVVRGATNALVSSSTAAEITVSGLTSFDSDGFTLGSNLDTNLTTHTYVGWCWKGGTPENYTPPSASVRFDGTGDYLDVTESNNDFDFDGDFTIEFWVYFNTVNARNDTVGSANNSAYLGASKSGWIASYYTLGGNKWHFSYQSNQAWIFEHTFSFTSEVSRWYHVAFTRENSSVKCFVDGVQQGATQTSSTTLTSTENSVRVGGGEGSTSLLLDGSVSNLRIIKGTALYTSNFTSPSEPLTNVTNTKLLCCQSATSPSTATVAPGSITTNGDAAATTHNPFDNYRVDGRVYETAAEAGLTAGTKASLLAGASVNTESGFSILTWTGDGANSTSTISIPHGLSTRPKMVVIKKRNEAVDHWYVAHDGIEGNNYAYRMFWGPTKGGNLPDASTTTTDPYYLATQSSNDTLFLNNTTTNGGGNENNIAYVAYCWSEVPGFSKMGSYVGNGNYEGSFVECGFRPAWVMVKVAGGSTGNSWTVWDNKRDPNNEMNLYLHPNETQQDGSYSLIKMDFLSNGFKPRGDIVHQNTNGVKYIFVAFAEAPTSNLYGGQANAR